MRASAAAALLALLPAFATAQERVGVRVGDHATHGRVVFDWPREVGFRIEQAEGRVTILFAAPASFDLAATRRLPRNVTALSADGERVEIRIPEGARPRAFRLGTRIVLDVADAAPAGSATPAATRQAEPPRPPAARPAAPTRPAPTAPSPIPASAPTAAPPPALAAPAAAAPPPAAAPAVPLAPAAPRAAAVRLLPAGGLAVPASAETGAALLRRGGQWLVVFDAPTPLDLRAVAQHPQLGRAETSSGPNATTLRVPAAAFEAPVLRREGDAWVLEAAGAAHALRSILPEVEAGPPARLLLRTAAPGSSLPVLDPETGGVLLVGTLRETGAATPLGRRSATLEILPTRLGVAILPRADTVTLRALADRFVADAAPGAMLALGDAPQPGSAEGAAMSRHFDLPGEALPALQERLRNATAAVAAAAPLGRGQPRLRAAEAMLALGLPQEAQSMAALAMRDDPRLAEAPRARALHGAAALLAGRINEAEGLAAAGLPDTDEAALWRALRIAARSPDAVPPEAAAAIAGALPLLLSYPEPLQARLLPLAAEALLAGREMAAARRLLAARPAGEAGLALARARLLEAEGAVDEALAAFAELGRGRDRRARALALRQGAELGLASGRLDAAAAAAAMESTIAAWRGDALESEARLRLAALRQAAGDPRGAFDMLRETEALFADLAPRLRPAQAEALLGALEREPPVAAVALFDAHHELLPAGAVSDAASAALARRLAALDLTDRAQQVLRRAVARAAGDEARGRLGVQLAALALGGGDPAGAREALHETASPDLSAPLVEERTLLEARALAQGGQVAEAAARFRAAGAAGLPELAELLAERQDWAGAAAALQQVLPLRLPASPTALDEPQRRLVVRTAALLALAGDEAGLATLRAAEATRMAGGPLDDAFALITGEGVAAIADLPRLRQQLDLARALPARLDSLRADSVAAR